MRILALVLFSLVAFTAAIAQDDKPAADPQTLVGKAAPELNLDLLTGGKVKLSDHKNKHLVIIDFWATWCPPCVAELPWIDEVVKARADKGVVFYAINEEEDAKDIEQFVEGKNLAHLKIPLDKDGAASKAYLVEGLPQAVIIGKDGVVKSVHVGITSKEDFAKALDEVLAKEAK